MSRRVVSNSPGTELGAWCVGWVKTVSPSVQKTWVLSPLRLRPDPPRAGPPRVSHRLAAKSGTWKASPRGVNRRLSKEGALGSPNLGEAEQGPGGDEAGEAKGVVHSWGPSAGNPHEGKGSPRSPCCWARTFRPGFRVGPARIPGLGTSPLLFPTFI